MPLREWRGADAQGFPGGLPDLPRRRLDVDRLRSDLWRPGAAAFCGHPDRRDDFFVKPLLRTVSRPVIRRLRRVALLRIGCAQGHVPTETCRWRVFWRKCAVPRD